MDYINGKLFKLEKLYMINMGTSKALSVDKVFKEAHADFFFYNIAHAIYIRNQLRDREIKKKFLTMNACFLSHVEKMSTMGWCFPLKQGWEA